MDFARRARGLSDEKKLSVAALSETMPPSAISRWN
jgi:hypothetical protein